MQFRNSIRLVAVLAGLTGTLATVAVAQDQTEAALKAAVNARQAQMTLYSFNLGQLGAMAKGEVDYDAEAASKAAANLSALAQLDQSRLWPAGSDSMDIEGSRALPDIWDNLPDVMEKSQGLVTAAAAMKDAAGTDLTSLQAALGGLGGACSACHKAYRQPD